MCVKVKREQMEENRGVCDALQRTKERHDKPNRMKNGRSRATTIDRSVEVRFIRLGRVPACVFMVKARKPEHGNSVSLDNGRPEG